MSAMAWAFIFVSIPGWCNPMSDQTSAPAMDAFYSQPVLNSPYEEPQRHWGMD